jgi:hypothetical protein
MIQGKKRSEVMKTGLLKITPEMAKKCLESNKISNRNLSSTRVAAMVDDINNGHWKLTHQGIAFDDKGNLLDGQHRLEAIRQSGKPVTMLVTRGLPLDAVIAIDNVRPRSVSDHALQLGFSDIKTHHSAIAAIIEYGPDVLPHLSMQTKLDLISKYHDAIIFAYNLSKHAVGFQAPCRAVMARAWYTQDRDKLERFIDVYKSGLTESKSEWAAIVLKKYLTRSNLYGWAMRKEVYQKTEMALSNFLKNIEIRQVYVTERELFGIPPDFF